MITLLVLSTMLLPAETDTPLGMILEVKGKVEARSPRRDARSLKVCDFVYKEDELHTAADSLAIVVFFVDSHKERTRSGQKATVNKSGCTPAEAVEVLKPAVAGKKTIDRGLRKLKASSRGAVSVLRSPADEEKPAVIPIAGARLVTDKPNFSWPTVAKANKYRIEVSKATGLKVWSAETSEARLPYPVKEKPLPRGREFIWRVYAFSEDDVKQCGHGGFYVCTVAEAAEFEKLKKLADSGNKDSMVLAAIGYEGSEMYSEALAIYERLCREAPSEPAFHAARAELLERAGRKADARAAWAEAKKAGYQAK